MSDTVIETDIFAGLHPIFRECVGDDVRYALDTPFLSEHEFVSHVYATDAKIIVRMPARLLTAAHLDAIAHRPHPASRRPPVGPMFGLYKHLPEPVAIPAGLNESMWCLSCGGYGCKFCDFAGRIPDRAPLEVAPGYHLAHVYIGRLARHGATVYTPTGKGWPTHPARFTLPGEVEGLVMPIDPKSTALSSPLVSPPRPADPSGRVPGR